MNQKKLKTIDTKKLHFWPIFDQLLINHCFMGPQVGVTWTALARGFQNGRTIAISPKNEASMLKSLNSGKIKDFSK